MYNHFELNLFLILIGKFEKIQTFSLDWPDLSFIRAE